MTTCFKHSDSFIARQPRLSYYKIFKIIEDSTEALAVIQSDDFKRAILWVSENLFSEYSRFMKDELDEKDSSRMWRTLMKYAIRMCSRSTPFGEFASISTGKIFDQTKLTNSNQFKRFVYLDSLVEHILFHKIINKEFLKNNQSIHYNLNGSLIQKGCQYIFLRQTENGKFKFCTCAHNPLLKYLYHTKPKSVSFKNLFERLSLRFDVNNEVLSNFITSIIENGILIPSIRPEAMNKTWLSREHPSLSSDTIRNVCDIMDNLRIIEIDNSTDNIENNLSKIKNIINFDTKNIKCFVQTVCYGSSNKKLSREIVYKIINSISFFSKICKKRDKNNNLRLFIEKFQKRYDGQSVPLIEVLHPEIGIGYGNSCLPNSNELVLGLKSKNPAIREERGIDDPFELIMQKKLNENSNKPIKLTIEDVSSLNSSIVNLPATMSAIFNIAGANNDVISELHFSGSSATCLLGRFTLGSRSIHRIAKEISSHEERYYGVNKIVSEINLLPNYRCGNVNYRTKFRKSRISMDLNSSKSDIPLSNILVSIINGKIILTDKSTGKQIIPRLSSAHNNYAETDVVYQFLGDVQCQSEITAMMFSWGNLRKIYNHFPRVYYDDIIISLEQWYLNVDSIKANNKVSSSLLHDWFLKNDVKRYIKLVDGDKELFVDIENKLCIEILIDEIKNKKNILLKECLESSNKSSNSHYSCQIIIPIFNHKLYE